MIAVRIPKEIREYKTKVWKRFTARNLLAICYMFLVVGFCFFQIRPIVGMDKMEDIIFVLCLPAGVLGFLPQKNGLKPETLIKMLVRFYLIKPKKRKFESINFFDFSYKGEHNVNNTQRKGRKN